ncbi:MAG: BatA domain-containing protein [Bacteroidales bacterium]|nr:BatA domain-containing protein [Bacteroidales bacterium]
MQFVNPFFLIALTALAIPILIHLFNFRKYKKVFFTNVHFLQEIQQETKKQSQLKQLLILLARLLALASLVFAFAQPYLPDSKQQKKITKQRAVSIYLDNSFSMEAVATEGKLMDIAKTKALEISSAYAPSDLFQLVTNDFEGRHQRFVSLEDFRKLVEEVQVSSSSRSISEVINRQNDLLLENQKFTRDAFLVSDFQKNTASLLQAKPDSGISWFLVPLSAQKRDNLYIDSVFFISPVHQPGQPVSLRVRIHNSSGESLEKNPVKLRINGVQKAISSFSVAANSTTEVTLPFTENASGIQYGQVEIVDYPIVYDDIFYFSYPVLPSIPVLCINEKGGNNYLNALFENDSSIRFTNSQVNQVDYSNLFSNALLILNSPDEISSGLAQELTRYVRSGGHLVVFPPVKGSVESYNTLLSLFALPGYSGIDTVRQRIAGVNVESAIYNDVFEKNASGKIVLPQNIDLPVVQKHYILRQDIRSGEEVLLKLQSNHPFLISAPVDKGKVYLFSAPADDSWTLFPKHMIFVPTLFKIALVSNPSRQLYFTASENSTIEIPADSILETNIYKIKKVDSPFEFIPEIRKFGSNVSLITHDQIKEAGFYTISRGKKPNAGLAFNFNRKESDLSYFKVSELEQQISRLSVKDIRILKEQKSSLSREINEIKQGTPLWKFFLILALIFIACEIALIRLMK